MSDSPTSVLRDPAIDGLLQSLHAKSDAQAPETERYFRTRSGPWKGMEARDHAHLADKLVALDRSKCEFLYLLCRATRAKRIVEVGTSYGVSTLYLAAAVRDNGGGQVIASEHEPAKANVARENFSAARLSSYIELREGDVLETFKTMPGPVNLVLFDIWGHVVRRTLDLLLPHLHAGSIVCADNTGDERNRKLYAGFFEIINDPSQGFRTLTLPFQGGFEMAIKF